MANKEFNLNSFCLDDYLDFVDKGSKKKKKKKLFRLKSLFAI